MRELSVSRARGSQEEPKGGDIRFAILTVEPHNLI